MRSSPVVEGLGFPLNTRGQIFYLDLRHPNCLAPGKKPRTTLSPSLALKRGKPYLVFGTPGADQQDQWTLQFFLNHVDFGMNPQQAIDAPTVHSLHFPGSFYPHGSVPGRLVVEGRIPESTRRALLQLGHDVQVTDEWANGRVLAIGYDTERNVRYGAASPRLETGYAIGW
jgi:gamma-glutamyltranspeptidase/glutathione hydrolase